VVTRADFEIMQLQITDSSQLLSARHTLLILCCASSKIGRTFAACSPDWRRTCAARCECVSLFSQNEKRNCSACARFFAGPRCAGTFICRPDWSFSQSRGGFASPTAQHRPCSRRSQQERVLSMLGWVVTFLVIALIAGILGFGGVAGASIEIAKIIFFIAIVLFLVSAIVGVVRGRRI
jgi:uncharacterized membrane protein YtjA (UPF0391 family)